MIYRKLKNLQVALNDTKNSFLLTTFQLHTYIHGHTGQHVMLQTKQTESRCLVCFPIATGFGGLTLRKGRGTFLFFF